jgi:hypothetical protein
MIQLLCFRTLSIVLFLFRRHNVSETGFCVPLQVEPTHLGPIDRASPYLRTPASESESKLCYDRQSVGQSWNKSPIWGLRPDLYYCRTVAGLLMWGALSDERTGLSFARVISLLSVCTIYILLLLNMYVYIFNIFKASISPGSVQQIMPYH